MGALTSEGVLTERAQHLFKTLIQRYIRDGHPVGSRQLSRDSGLDLSAATVRNVMADLEEAGLLRSPHTSAGRVPTVRGYRFFVDTLLRIEPPDSDEMNRLRAVLNPEQDSTALLAQASSLLSDITRLAGVVMLPRQERVTLRQVEFLALSGTQVLVILVVNDREVQNRIITTQRRYGASELEQAANYINHLCAGKDLNGVRRDILTDLQAMRERMDRMMEAVIEMAEKALAAPQPDDDLLVAGQTHLMEYGELADMERLRQLFEAFTEKRDILHLLDQCLQSSGVQIYIGEESGHEVLDECSVVTAPYETEGRVIGVLGVIGPTRMAYDRVIPIVDVTARLLGAALNRQH